MRPKNDSKNRLSHQHRPDGMELHQWQTRLRRQAAERGSFSVAEISDRWSPGQYSVSGSQSKRTYRVVYEGPSSEWNYCDCMDFRTNCLGTCKHLQAVELWLERKGKKPSAATMRSALCMSYPGGRRLKLRLGEGAPESLAVAAMRYFDDDLVAVPGMVAELPAFIEHARRIDPQFHCYPDALNFILEERDRRRRLDIISEVTPAEIDSLLRTTLYPYQAEGIRFAFAAGRVLIADEMGLGKTVQAIGTAELMRKRNHHLSYVAEISVEKGNRTFHRLVGHRGRGCAHTAPLAIPGRVVL